MGRGQGAGAGAGAGRQRATATAHVVVAEPNADGDRELGRDGLLFSVDRSGQSLDAPLFNAEGERLGNIGMLVGAEAELRLGLRDPTAVVAAQTAIVERYQGRGVGTDLYRQVGEILHRQGKTLYSDTTRSPAAEGLWRKLAAEGRAVKVPVKVAFAGEARVDYVWRYAGSRR